MITSLLDRFAVGLSFSPQGGLTELCPVFQQPSAAVFQSRRDGLLNKAMPCHFFRLSDAQYVAQTRSHIGKDTVL